MPPRQPAFCELQRIINRVTRHKMLRLVVLALSLVISCGVSGEQINMHNVEGCNAPETKGVGVSMSCSFNGNITLNNQYNLYAKVTSFDITLADGARLTIQEGFFCHEKVEYFQVKGGEFIELTFNATNGLNANKYPRIEIVDCKSVVFESRSFAGKFRLNVTAVKTLHVLKDAFKDSLRFDVLFSHVDDLQIDEGALLGLGNASLVNVMHSRMHNLLPFHIKVITSIRFKETIIDRIQENAFGPQMNVDVIEFRNCKIPVIQSLAFAEQTKIKLITFAECTIQTFQIDAMKSEFGTLTLENNTIHRIDRDAIVANVVETLHITNNTIIKTDELWFNPTNWPPVIFTDCVCNQSWPRNLFRNSTPLKLKKINCLLDKNDPSVNMTHLNITEYQMQVCNKTKPNIASETRIQMPKNLVAIAGPLVVLFVLLIAVIVCRHFQKSEVRSRTSRSNSFKSSSCLLEDRGITWNDAVDDNEHVYAEPLTILQPTPLDMYSLPVDTQNYAVYAEPHRGG